MNIELTTKNLQKLCRICLCEGKLNLWQHKLKFEDEDKEIALHKVFRIFDGQISNLDLATEMPLICEQCLDELIQCHRFCQKLEKGNKQMKKLYAEAQQIEAELSTEVKLDLMAEDENENEEHESYVEEHYYLEQIKQGDFQTHEILETSPNTKLRPAPRSITGGVRKSKGNESTVTYANKRQRNNHTCNVQKDAQLVVTKFISTAHIDNEDNRDNREESIIQSNNSELLTLDYAAIEVRANNLDELIDDDEINPHISPSNYSNDSTQPIYMCKYCPQAFAIPQYLIAHVRKSHVCKFCTKAYQKTTDLHDHLNKEHKQHRCAICGKELSSHSNLRAHIKRLHGLQLPAQVALLDYKPSDSNQNPLDE